MTMYIVVLTLVFVYCSSDVLYALCAHCPPGRIQTYGTELQRQLYASGKSILGQENIIHRGRHRVACLCARIIHVFVCGLVCISLAVTLYRDVGR
jgi:hypothetical protein